MDSLGVFVKESISIFNILSLKSLLSRDSLQAKKISYDGISFASGLERYTYIA